jgi:sensor domain CHASE-containing protein
MGDIQFLILIVVLIGGFWAVIHYAARDRTQKLELSRIEHTLEGIKNLLVSINDRDKPRGEK